MGSGIEFPVGPNGKISTSYFGKLILSQSIKELNPELSRSIQQERNWRKAYYKFLPDYQKTCSGSIAISELISQHSLNACHDLFRFHRDGMDMPLSQAMSTLDDGKLYSGKVVGEKSFSGSLTVKYGKDRVTTRGLKYLLNRWVDKGIVELSHGNDVKHILNDPQLMDLRNQTFVVLGGTSEVGPLKTLLQLGATVFADLSIW